MSVVRPLLLIFLLVSCAEKKVDDEVRSAPRAAPARPDDPFTVRVASFNLRWGGFDDGADAWPARRELACDVVGVLAADSIGLQEPTPAQVDDVLAANPSLAEFRHEDRTQPILYRHDRFDLAASGGFRLVEATPSLEGSERHGTWVHLIDRASGRGYVHYNVHLDHRSARSRRRSAVRLAAAIAARETDDPFVVTGDFNCGEASATLSFLRGERALPDDRGAPSANPVPLVDTFRVRHPDMGESGTASGFGGATDGAKIDYVLVRPDTYVDDAAIVRMERDGRFPSDHFPVVATVSWGR